MKQYIFNTPKMYWGARAILERESGCLGKALYLLHDRQSFEQLDGSQRTQDAFFQRQREGIAIAKYTGRKVKQSPDFDRVVAQWCNGEISAVEAMRTLKMSKTTFYRRAQQAANRSALGNRV